MYLYSGCIFTSACASEIQRCRKSRRPIAIGSDNGVGGELLTSNLRFQQIRERVFPLRKRLLSSLFFLDAMIVVRPRSAEDRFGSSLVYSRIHLNVVGERLPHSSRSTSDETILRKRVDGRATSRASSRDANTEGNPRADSA